MADTGDFEEEEEKEQKSEVLEELITPKEDFIVDSMFNSVRRLERTSDNLGNLCIKLVDDLLATCVTFSEDTKNDLSQGLWKYSERVRHKIRTACAVTDRLMRHGDIDVQVYANCAHDQMKNWEELVKTLQVRLDEMIDDHVTSTMANLTSVTSLSGHEIASRLKDSLTNFKQVFDEAQDQIETALNKEDETYIKKDLVKDSAAYVESILEESEYQLKEQLDTIQSNTEEATEMLKLAVNSLFEKSETTSQEVEAFVTKIRNQVEDRKFILDAKSQDQLSQLAKYVQQVRDSMKSQCAMLTTTIREKISKGLDNIKMKTSAARGLLHIDYVKFKKIVVSSMVTIQEGFEYQINAATSAIASGDVNQEDISEKVDMYSETMETATKDIKDFVTEKVTNLLFSTPLADKTDNDSILL